MLLRGEAINLAHYVGADTETLGDYLEAGDKTIMFLFFKTNDPNPPQAFMWIQRPRIEDIIAIPLANKKPPRGRRP